MRLMFASESGLGRFLMKFRSDADAKVSRMWKQKQTDDFRDAAERAIPKLFAYLRKPLRAAVHNKDAALPAAK